MNAVQRKQQRHKRLKHHLKQTIKANVKAMCKARGIDFSSLQYSGDNLVVWDRKGRAYTLSAPSV